MHQGRLFNVVWIVALYCLWGGISVLAQEKGDIIKDYTFGRSVGADTVVIDDENNLFVYGDTMPEGRFRNPLEFTRREIKKTKDPRVRDQYWYALNDTSDWKRYLKAHYAFNSFRDNWTWTIGAGAQSVVLDGMDDEFRLGSQFEIGFIKDIHPYWSVRVNGQLSKYRKKVNTAHLSTFTDNWEDYPQEEGFSSWEQQLKYSTVTFRGDVMLDVLNLCAGRELIYNPFDLYVYLGPGLAYSAHDLGNREGSCFVPFWSVGGMINANFSKRWGVYLDLNASWQGDDIEGFAEQCSAYKFSAMVGLAYKFSRVIHFQRLGYDESDLQNQLNDAYREGDQLANYINNLPSGNQMVQLPPELIQAAFFQIDRIELAHVHVLNLGFYADLIKKVPGQHFLVRGFADLEVGSRKRNEWLCQKRAEVVADVLVNTYGVNPNQLIVGGGDLELELPFLRENGHHRFNRCVIVAPLGEDYKIIKEKSFKDDSELMDGRVKSKIEKSY